MLSNFQNLSNLINLLIKKKWEYVFKCFFLKKSLMCPVKSWCGVPIGTTQQGGLGQFKKLSIVYNKSFIKEWTKKNAKRKIKS